MSSSSSSLPEHITEILPLPSPNEAAELAALMDECRLVEHQVDVVDEELRQVRTYADKLRRLEAKTAAMRQLFECDDRLEQKAFELAAQRRLPRNCRSLMVKINEHYRDERRNQLFAVTPRRMLLLGQSRSLSECQAALRWWQERLDDSADEGLGVIAM